MATRAELKRWPEVYALNHACEEGWAIMWDGDGAAIRALRAEHRCYPTRFGLPPDRMGGSRLPSDAAALEHVRRRAEEGSAWHADALRIAGPCRDR